MSWIQDIVSPRTRRWEEFYRNRHQYDKIVRSTHGVNCTGGCSWQVFVKDGVITWELQYVDHPKLEKTLPPYEPRGCQRGISASWYIYAPIRVKYPYMRGALIDIWRKARDKHADPVDAWASIQSDPQLRRKYQKCRGMGGFRRIHWDEAIELYTSANIHTIKTYGPDRIVGFCPIPAKSQLTYASGARYLQLCGGVNLSFYDWYCDLPPASPEIWGEQTDVQESADWYNSKFIISMGACLNMTRTPDTHFIPEARQNGSKFVVMAPDFSMVTKFADWWIPINAGTDGAFWQSVVHVILQEFYVDRQVPYFIEYQKQYCDSPLIVRIEEGGKPGKFLRANTVDKYKDEENGDWKFLMWDEDAKEPKMPMGGVGHRWQKKQGQWNLKLEDGLDGSTINPQLSFIDDHDEIVQVEFEDFSDNNKMDMRGVPVKNYKTNQGVVQITTAFDLLMAQHGVSRGLAGDYPTGYDDTSRTFSPAWQEKFTGINAESVKNFARQFASTAEHSRGQCTVIVGAAINHWYHNNLMYRSSITALMFCGCIGVNGGGLAHYVGQEKLAPMAAWKTITLGIDHGNAPRVQNAPTWHYVHSDQWRYEGPFSEYSSEKGDNAFTAGHTVDANARAVRMGWLPFYPQFEKSSIEIVKEARSKGAKTDADVVNYVVDLLKSKSLVLAAEDPDNELNWPRTWVIWKGNAINASAKGQEYFFRHYLGTHSNAIADEKVNQSTLKEVKFRDPAPIGKMDLIIDLNFRMDTSALYSDIVLPAAHWYEKNDINTTDMHTFIHPLSEVVPPNWEARSDWDIFRALAKKMSEMAQKHLPEPMDDLILTPLGHDSAAEIAQPNVKDWGKGECDLIPGKTGPGMKIITRDYTQIYNKYITYGRNARGTIGAHGANWDQSVIYDKLLLENPTVEVNGETYTSMYDVLGAINVVMRTAPELNGEAVMLAFEAQEKRVGVPLMDLGAGNAEMYIQHEDIQAQQRRTITSPCWSGICNSGRAYSPFTMQVDRLVPWRTLTGRQTFYMEHEGYIAFGEHLPTFKPKCDPMKYGDMAKQQKLDNSLMLNYLTPHGKWHIHSTYYDNLRMLTLSRGLEPFWLSEKDAHSVGIHDNDWVEAYNDHGVVVTRASVSARVPSGICIFYHAPERTISFPKSPLRGMTTGGTHNSLTRVRLNPILMMGGYGQWTFGFNYWGPTGVNRDTHILVRKLKGAPQFSPTPPTSG